MTLYIIRINDEHLHSTEDWWDAAEAAIDSCPQRFRDMIEFCSSVSKVSRADVEALKAWASELPAFEEHGGPYHVEAWCPLLAGGPC